jgi:lysozyme
MMTKFPPDSAVLALAKPLIKQFEGFEARPYLCPAQKWTIAWGTTRYPSGKAVTRFDYPDGIAPDFANVCLVSSMLRVWGDAAKLLTVMPTSHQSAAILCLTYNIGVGVRDGVKGDFADSTLLQKFNAGDVAGAAEQFMLWNKAHVNGVLTELPGLTRRREAERTLFLTPDA